ncbi:SRPBCC family protein [Mycobacterium talmoniae]|uniref:Dimethyladenosine transferase n=1 Tax=Mycobacterium talmoniae TaxID=1858794 RepID=A0A1S1NLH0_9MYCO|nr:MULTISPECIES: SRPBCC family protein [Mycobacterium]OHV04987.1 hypothetical protein BKN37_07640 [Mycobacterium talmoniae]PQM48349.1 hypothetical protein C1Y40_01432 [Mycobacterium talmoniae]TDH53123.1 dimethyladenosine transferase [Mycobacterium eburneum]
MESAERIIAAPADRIFALLTDPARHCEFDGSGAVRGVRGPTTRLTLGSRFGMSMRKGLPYAMISTVIEYQENRRLAWQTRGPTALGRYVGGRIWRYELQPVDGGTLVQETWDISKESALTKWMVRPQRAATRRNMAATLARIERIVCG